MIIRKLANILCASITAVVFFCNSLSFASADHTNSTDTLSAPLTCGELKPGEHKDIALIEWAYKNKQDSISNPQSVSVIADEDTIFFPRGIYFVTQKPAIFGDLKMMLCRIGSTQQDLREFYIVVDARTNELIETYPQRELVDSINAEGELCDSRGNVIISAENLPRLLAEDRHEIDRYADQNEAVIDTVIRGIIHRGDFTEFENRAASIGIIDKYPGRKSPKYYIRRADEVLDESGNPESKLKALQGEIYPPLMKLGINPITVVQDRNIVFLKATEEQMPSIDRRYDDPGVSDEERWLTVRAHTSVNAQYYFVPPAIYDLLFKDWTDNDVRARVFDYLCPLMAHEAGAACKLGFTVENGQVRNAASAAYAGYAAADDKEAF